MREAGAACADVYTLQPQQWAVPERLGHRAQPSAAKPRRRHDTFTLDLFSLEGEGAALAQVGRKAPAARAPKVTNGLQWMTTQITSMHAPEPVQPKNPRPAGVIRPASGTDVLLRFLRQSPGRWFFHYELILALGRSKGEIDWALGFLVRERLAESRLTELPARKPVLRYRLMEGAGT